MYKLNSITFKDENSEKIIEVKLDKTVTSSQHLTPDDYVTTSILAEVISQGGFKALQDFMNIKSV